MVRFTTNSDKYVNELAGITVKGDRQHVRNDDTNTKLMEADVVCSTLTGVIQLYE